MPITAEELKELLELEERWEGINLGTYLYEIGKNERRESHRGYQEITGG